MALKIDYSLRLPDGQFFPAARKKTGIAIHHTVGGTAFSTVGFCLGAAGAGVVIGTLVR